MSNTVAKMRYTAPERIQHVIRGTVPLPEGFKYTKYGPSPLSAWDSKDKPLITQWEPVKYYPNGDVAIAEIIAYREADVDGSQVIKIKDLPYPWSAPELPKYLVDAILKPMTIGLVMDDIHGNKQICELNLDPKKFDDWRILKWGVNTGCVEFSAEFGDSFAFVQGYWTLQKGSNVVSLDLTIHNCSMEKPKENVYFQDLKLIVPRCTNVESVLPMPGFGEPYEAGGMTVYPLIEEADPGTYHVIPQGFQTQMRFTFAFEQFAEEQQDFMDNPCFAVAINDSKVSASWQKIPNYGSGFHVPDLATFGDTSAKVLKDFHSHMAALDEGTAIGGSQSKRMGLFHPEGAPYKGVTGGDGIDYAPGYDVLASGKYEGILKHMAHLYMMVCRQNQMFLRSDGTVPPVYEAPPQSHPTDWNFFWGIGFSKGDPWGWKTVDKPDTNAVSIMGATPTYEADLLKWEAHDAQHLSRATFDAQVLVDLYNDPLSRRWLLNMAEMSLYEQAEKEQLNNLNFAKQKPGTGCMMSREQGWLMNSVAQGAALLPPAERDRFKEWFDRYHETMQVAQMYPGNGSALHFSHGKVTKFAIKDDVLLYVATSMMASFHCINGYTTAIKWLYAPDTPEYQAAKVIKENAAKGLVETAWNPEKSACHFEIACATADLNHVFANWDEIPQDGYGYPQPPYTYYDGTNFWAALFAGLSMTEPGSDTEKTVLRGLTRFAGIPDSFGTLFTLEEAYAKEQERGLNNMNRRAGLVGELQRRIGLI